MHTKYKGYLGELLASVLLMLKGFSVLERRYRTVCGEIDIIAQRENLIIFVEVKVRKNSEKCYNAIKNKQMKRIRRASEIFLGQNPEFLHKNIRFDIILISRWSIPVHLENVNI
ncbi:MAG: YraN family protein [Holosporaceae bacterium]|nr:YraN family protein [Holosporaceae bacterium]